MQVRQQQLEVSEADQKRSEQQLTRSGGMFAGQDPARVLEFSRKLIFATGSAALLAVVLNLLLPYGVADKVVLDLGLMFPIVIGWALLAQPMQLARQDQKAEKVTISGQLLAASEFSALPGLGTIALQTKQGLETVMAPAEQLDKLPGNPVPVVIQMTPGLHHVTAVTVMGKKLVPRPKAALPPQTEQLRQLMLRLPFYVAGAGLAGDALPALLPIPNDILHASIALVLGTGAAVGTFLYLQKQQKAALGALEAVLG